MKITKDCIVKLEYMLKDSDGTVIDSSKDTQPLEYLHGYNLLVPGLERALENREKGESFSEVIQPKDGYGEVNEDAVFNVDRSQFPDGVELAVGMQFEANGNAVSIKAISGDSITIDANHKLAGKTLYFDIEIVAVRAASDKEIADILQPLMSGCGGGCCGSSEEHSCGGCSGCQ